MRLSRRAAAFLLVVGVWTAFVWIVLVRNIARDHDHGSGFHAVHYVLAAVALALDAGVLWIGGRGWVRADQAVRLEARRARQVRRATR